MRARGARRSERPTPALDGLRVVELADGIAAAYAGKLLRDQGAHVVKVEGDGALRHWSAATPDAPVDGTGALFAFLHGGKASVTEVDADLPRWADLVISEGAVTDASATRPAWSRSSRSAATVRSPTCKPPSSRCRRGAGSCRGAERPRRRRCRWGSRTASGPRVRSPPWRHSPPSPRPAHAGPAPRWR